MSTSNIIDLLEEYEQLYTLKNIVYDGSLNDLKLHLNTHKNIKIHVLNTVLMDMYFYNHDLEKIKLLIDYGADLNTQNKYGMTLLMYEAMQNKLEGVIFFLENDADPTLINEKGLTAYDLAGDPEIKEVLRNAIIEEYPFIFERQEHLSPDERARIRELLIINQLTHHRIFPPEILNNIFNY